MTPLGPAGVFAPHAASCGRRARGATPAPSRGVMPAPSHGVMPAQAGIGFVVNPRRDFRAAQKQKPPAVSGQGFLDKALSDDLLSHGLSHTTIGAGAFHFR